MIQIKTCNGYKNFDTVSRTEAGSGLEIVIGNETITCTPDHKLWNNGDYVRANTLRIGDDVNGKTVHSIKVVPGEYFYDAIDVDGHHYTANNIEVSNCAYLNPLKFEEFKDGVLPSQSSLAWKKTIFMSTANGMNHFYHMVKGAKARKTFKNVSQEEVEKIKRNHKVLDVRKYEDSYDVIVDEPANGHRLIEVDWKDVPRYHDDGTVKTPDEFKEEVIAKHGVIHFNQAYANCIDGSCVVSIKNKDEEFDITLEELYEYLDNGDFQAHHLEVLTKSGYSKFKGVRKTYFKKGWAIVTDKKTFYCSSNHRFWVDNRWMYPSALKVGQFLGDYKITWCKPVKKYMALYDILSTNDSTYIADGIINHNCFIGSSHTLISGERLSEMTGQEPIEVRDNKLNIYEYPVKGHSYIMSVDPAKDGADGFAVCIIDITEFPFKQVAACSLNIDYFLMPEHLSYWGEFYNMAFIIVENNEGAGQSVADLLWREYEYDNLYFNKKNYKKYPGFRTTPKTRKLILDTLKMFIENNNLILNDSKTINELYTFILINSKYQADEGCHDDRVMSLALCFAPFCEVKNFSEAKDMIGKFYQKDTNINFTDYITIGYFDV